MCVCVCVEANLRGSCFPSMPILDIERIALHWECPVQFYNTTEQLEQEKKPGVGNHDGIPFLVPNMA